MSGVGSGIWQVRGERSEEVRELSNPLRLTVAACGAESVLDVGTDAGQDRVHSPSTVADGIAKDVSRQAPLSLGEVLEEGARGFRGALGLGIARSAPTW